MSDLKENQAASPSVSSTETPQAGTSTFETPMPASAADMTEVEVRTIQPGSPSAQQIRKKIKGLEKRIRAIEEQRTAPPATSLGGAQQSEPVAAPPISAVSAVAELAADDIAAEDVILGAFGI